MTAGRLLCFLSFHRWGSRAPTVMHHSLLDGAMPPQWCQRCGVRR